MFKGISVSWLVKPGVIRKLISVKFLLGAEQDHHRLHIIFKTFYNHHQEKGEVTDPYTRQLSQSVTLQYLNAVLSA